MNGSDVLTLANQLTLLRMLLIPAFVILVVYGHLGWALVVFAVAGLTDALDGLIARKLAQKSSLGAWLDPMADKLLLTVDNVLKLSRLEEEGFRRVHVLNSAEEVDAVSFERYRLPVNKRDERGPVAPAPFPRRRAPPARLAHRWPRAGLVRGIGAHPRTSRRRREAFIRAPDTSSAGA